MTNTQAQQAEHTTDLLSILDLGPTGIAEVLDAAAALKADLARDPTSHAAALAGRAAVMLFEKPSLRTRVSFEVGMGRLGATCMYFEHAAQRIGQREPVRDYALNLERWVDCIIARVFDHAILEELAEHASIPVVNALSDREHPCQALADLLTIREHVGTLDRTRLAYIGDGNNVCHSLLLAAAATGMDMTVIAPPGFEPASDILAAARDTATRPDQALTISTDLAAAEGAHAIYTDTWVSMGQGSQTDDRLLAFEHYQVTERVMSAAATNAIFMHCLPAHREQEVASAVIDGPQSVVYDQTENRMHAQNTLLVRLLTDSPTHPTHADRH